MEVYNHTPYAHVAEYATFVVREAYTDYLIVNIPIGTSYPLSTKVSRTKVYLCHPFISPFITSINFTLVILKTISMPH